MALPEIDDWNTWRTEFLKFFKTNESADKAYCELLAASCNPLFLARFSYYSAIEVDSPLNQYRDKLRQFADKIAVSIPKITSSIPLLESLNKNAAELRAPINEFVMLPDQLSNYVISLESILSVCRRHSSKRLPKLSNHCLLVLHAYVSALTGGAQWSAVAFLLEAANFGLGKAIDVSKDAIRQKVNGLIEADPGRYESAQKQVESYLSAGNGNWFLPGEMEEIAQKAITDTLNGHTAESVCSKRSANPKSVK